jgi:hypothetical protein
MNPDDKITYFGETDSRNRLVKFGIKAKDRTRHVYVIGKTGMGKSTLLENMAVQDIQNGNGMAFLDPHGGTAEKLLNYIPEHRIKDVLYFAPFDLEHPISFNVLEDPGPDKRFLVVNGLMSVFKKIWVDAWSARMEYILSNILLALLENPGSTMIGVNRILADKAYRKTVVDNVKDPAVKAFWVNEFEKYGERYMQEAGAAIQNKIGQFISNPVIRNIIGQPKSSFDIRKIMDEGKIMIINLSKGRVGETNTNLLGSMLITKIYLAAMSRADAPEKVLKALPNFYLFVDEFQSFANESFANILSEARKYKLNLTIAHQYVEQMEEEVRAAVFGNVGSMIIFRIGPIDAEIFEKEFAPQFTAEDIVNLGSYQMYLRLMIDGIGSQPFSARSLPPIQEPSVSFKNQAIENSRLQFTAPREDAEDYVRKQSIDEPKKGSENRNPQSRPSAPGASTPVQPPKQSPAVSVVKTSVAPLVESKPTPQPLREKVAPAPQIQPERPAQISLNALKSDTKNKPFEKPVAEQKKDLEGLRSLLSTIKNQKDEPKPVAEVTKSPTPVVVKEKIVQVETQAAKPVSSIPPAPVSPKQAPEKDVFTLSFEEMKKLLDIEE